MPVLGTLPRKSPSRCWHRLPRGWFVGSLLVALLAIERELPAQTAASREYSVKAVFLFNFAQFVEWPETAFPAAETPLVIGVLGEDPFGAYLDETVRGEKVNNRPLVIERYHRVEEIKTCHILFISRSETDRLEKIFAGLKGRNILMVGDSDRFCGRG